MELNEYFEAVAYLDDVDKAAGEVIDMLGNDWQSVIYPAILSALSDYRRSRVRTLERQVFPTTSPRLITTKVRTTGKPTALTQNQLRKQLLDETFSVGGGRPRILWGRATREDHLERIAYFTRAIVGHQDTIRQHEEAIALIDATPGATCLNDVWP